MSDVFTDTTAVNDIVTTAYELMAYPSLRPRLVFEGMADVRATRQSHRGSTVQFEFIGDLAAKTSTLSENTDVEVVGLTSDPLNVSLAEYGNAVATSAKVRGTGFIDIDPIAAERIGYNAGLSVDTLARTALEGTSNVLDLSGGANNLIGSRIRVAKVTLQEANVMPVDGDFYMAYIHPRQALDLRADTDAAAWRTPAVYGTDQSEIRRGEIGEYEGFRFVVTNRISTTGSGATGGFKSLFVGAEGLAKAVSAAPGFGEDPSIVVGERVDRLKRIQPVGWYHLVGYDTFRDAAVLMITTRSSLGV